MLLLFSKKNGNSCESYMQALTKTPKSNIKNISCAANAGSGKGFDDVAFDTSVVQNSVVTAYGLTCNHHYLTQVRNKQSYYRSVYYKGY